MSGQELPLLEVVLPRFNFGSACVALGLCRAAVTQVTSHLKAARLDHLGQSLGSAAMRAAGGAAFSKHLSIERLFRDAQAGAVMAPTSDVLREFIGRATLGMELF